MASERDEKAGERDDERADDDERVEEGRDADGNADREDARDRHDGPDDDEDDDRDEEPGDEQASARAAEIARALGVGDEPVPVAEPAAPVNRAERRRQRALERRAGRKQAEAGAGEAAAEPRDRNVRVRERAERRQRGEDVAEAQPAGLTTSEMIDDALARATARATQWMRRNLRTLVGSTAAVGLAALAWFGWTHWQAARAADASDQLARALLAELGRVVPEDQDKRSEEDKKLDVRRVFRTLEERDKAALEGYHRVVSADRTSGPGILARLGEAGVYLEARRWDDALAAYAEVLASKLAAADVDVKARALEGKAFALEGKGQPDEALARFTELAELPAPSFKILAQYHRGRLLSQKGGADRDKAKEILGQARKDIEQATIQGNRDGPRTPLEWLSRAVDAELRAIDPSAVPRQQMTPEALQELLRNQGIDPASLGAQE
jgi:hypothetical protein